jgi:hypothetical protein
MKLSLFWGDFDAESIGIVAAGSLSKLRNSQFVRVAELVPPQQSLDYESRKAINSWHGRFESALLGVILGEVHLAIDVYPASSRLCREIGFRSSDCPSGFKMFLQSEEVFLV